jgi:hypothetical protein
LKPKFQYHLTLCKNPDDERTQFNCGSSLQSCTIHLTVFVSYREIWTLTTGKQELNCDDLDLKNVSQRIKSAGSGCGSCRAKFFAEAHFCGSKAQLLTKLPKSLSIVFLEVRKSVLGSLSIVPKTPAVLPKYQPETNQENIIY